MKSIILMTAVVASLIIATTAQEASRQQANKDVEQVETGSNEAARDKRGFIITPLSALPADALAPLLPYLRALAPNPLLNKAATFLAPAQLVDSPAAAEPILPGLLSATAPLVASRAAAAVAAAPVSAQLLPSAPSVVPVPRLLPASRLVAVPPVVSPSNVVAAARLLPTSLATRVLPAAPPVVPAPTPLTARYAVAPAFTSFYPSARLTAIPLGTAPGVSSFYSLGNTPTSLAYNYAPQFSQLRSIAAPVGTFVV